MSSYILVMIRKKDLQQALSVLWVSNRRLISSFFYSSELKCLVSDYGLEKDGIQDAYEVSYRGIMT